MTRSSRRTVLALAAAAPIAATVGRASAQADPAAARTLPGAGRVAIVTGSSRGIGAATARRLATWRRRSCATSRRRAGAPSSARAT